MNTLNPKPESIFYQQGIRTKPGREQTPPLSTVPEGHNLTLHNVLLTGERGGVGNEYRYHYKGIYGDCIGVIMEIHSPTLS